MDSASSPRKISMGDRGDEEHLPLYEEFQHTEGQSDAVPDKKATPDQVREYLAHLLIDKRNLPLDYVRRTVSKWNVGSGHELRSYSPSMYLDIFGREDGWVIYREVKLAIEHEKRRKGGLTSKYGAQILFAVLTLWEAMMALLFFHTLGDANHVFGAMFGAIGGMFGGIFWFGSLVVIISNFFTKPEDNIEAELRAATKTSGQQ